MAGQVVNVFNQFQQERFETFQQMIKIGFLRFIVKPYMNKRNKLNSKDFNQGTKSGIGLTQNLAIYNVVNFFEDILRLVVASARRERLYQQRQTLMTDTESTYASQYAAGSFSESMLYMSNIKKAKQKVNSDIISKIKYYDGFFKKIAMNVIDTWKSRMQSQGKKDLQGDASFLKDKSKPMLNAIISGKNNDMAQKELLRFSSFLKKPTHSSSKYGEAFKSFGNNFVRSVTSIFSEKQQSKTSSLSEMKASTSFWDSIKRTQKQVAKYGGVELSGQFKAEMDALNNDINALHKMNTDNYLLTDSSSGKTSPVTLDQIEYVQSISKRLKKLADLSNLADDYNPVKIKITPLKDHP